VARSIRLFVVAILAVVLALSSAQNVCAQPQPGDYIVTQYNGNALSDITPGGAASIVYTFVPNTGPEFVAIDSAGNYIVAEFTVGILSRITPGGARTVVFTFIVPGSSAAYGVAVDSAGNYIVTETSAQVLSSITPSGTRTVIYSFAPGSNPIPVVIDHDGNYIVGELGVLSKISRDGSTRTVIWTCPPGLSPMGVAIDYAGNYIVTIASGGPTGSLLYRVTASGVPTLVYTFSPGTLPAGVVVNSAGNYVVAEQGTEALSQINPSGTTRTVIYTFPQGATPFGVAIVPSPPSVGAPVGGFMEPVNKLNVFAPYLALLGLVAAVAVVVAKPWKRDN